MSDLVIRATTSAQVTLYRLPAQLAAYARRAVDRLEREQTGQDLIEYAGILVVVAAVIVALITLEPHIKTAITTAVNSIVSPSGGSGSGTGTTPGG